MEYDVNANNHDAMVTLPAKLLNDLISVAGGYTMSHGEYLNKYGIIRDAKDALYYDSDFEVFNPTFLTGKYVDNKHCVAVRDDLTHPGR